MRFHLKMQILLLKKKMQMIWPFRAPTPELRDQPLECVFRMPHKVEDSSLSFHFPLGTCLFRRECRPLLRGTARLDSGRCPLGSDACGCERR